MGVYNPRPTHTVSYRGMDLELEYINDFVNAMFSGAPVTIGRLENGSYALIVDLEEDTLLLEVRKDNRFGRKLDS